MRIPVVVFSGEEVVSEDNLSGFKEVIDEGDIEERAKCHAQTWEGFVEQRGDFVGLLVLGLL